MPRLRQPCSRITVKCAFTSILVFVALTLILTFALSGRHGNRLTATMELETKGLSEKNMWRGVGVDRTRSDHINIDDVNVGAFEMTDATRPIWKRQRGGRGGALPEQSARHRASQEGMSREDYDRKQAMKVVNLLKMDGNNGSLSEVLAPTVSRKSLMAKVDFLRDSMISRSSMLSKPSSPPSCMGDIRPGEVEDIFCIPKPHYLEHVKNPCWYDLNLTSSDRPKLRCLPYFHILGCAKSGTTDLWNRLMSHPHIVNNYGAFRKEGLWWSWHRYGFSGFKKLLPVKFKNYVSLFRDTARQIQGSLENGNDNHKILITGDGSPPDFWDFRGWPNITQNRGLDAPSVITPHLMKHFYDTKKFILMFRDPIDRLYSDYFFIGSGLTSEDFHHDIVRSITMLADCVKQRSVQRCFYNQELYLKLPVRLPFACYSVFMREWLEHFPMESFFFIKTEEYEVKPEETLKDIINFLGLTRLRKTKLREMAEEERARITFQKKIAGPMKPETKAILTVLLQPCSELLARMIKQPRFVWEQ